MTLWSFDHDTGACQRSGLHQPWKGDECRGEGGLRPLRGRAGHVQVQRGIVLLRVWVQLAQGGVGQEVLGERHLQPASQGGTPPWSFAQKLELSLICINLGEENLGPWTRLLVPPLHWRRWVKVGEKGSEKKSKRWKNIELRKIRWNGFAGFRGNSSDLEKTKYLELELFPSSWNHLVFLCTSLNF